jgi:hypothetical protein
VTGLDPAEQAIAKTYTDVKDGGPGQKLDARRAIN